MRCDFCNQEIVRYETSKQYICNICPYAPEYYLNNDIAGEYLITFKINYYSKHYFVAFWKIPGENAHDVTKPETRIYSECDMIYREEGRIISSPQDAYNLFQRVINLKSFI